MNFLRPISPWSLGWAALLLLSVANAKAQATSQQPAQSQKASQQTGAPVRKSYPQALVDGGASMFQQKCAFCHGRDAGGGERGPDLTRSKLVKEDTAGDKIGAVVRNGRPDKGMPPFNLSDSQIAGLTAFIHTQQNAELTRKGGRKGVDVADLQTGNVEAGKQYFNGAGGCAACHSPTGDLSGVAKRYEGLALEEQMLYPKNAKSKVTVTPATGQTITGALEYLDEFTVGLVDGSGVYRSWRTTDVQFKVDAPVNAHVELFSKYTDADIHNLMAYLQTLR